MSFLGVLGGISTAAGAVKDFVNSGFSIANYFRQSKLQEESWEREDTAVQRRVADLRAAGLSPTLAAGSAAGSSAPIRLTAPEVETGGAMTAANEYARLIQQNADISKTAAEERLIELQQSNAVLAGNKLVAEEDEVRARTAALRQSTEFNVLANPERLQELIKRNRGLDQAYEIGILDKRLKDVGIDTGLLGNRFKAVEAQVAERFALPQAEAELLTKQLALAIQSESADWFRGQGMAPSGQGANMPSTLVGQVSNLGLGIFSEIRKKVGELFRRNP